MQLFIERDSLLYILPNLAQRGVIEETDGLYIQGKPVIKFLTHKQNEPSFLISGIKHRDLAVLDWFCNPSKKIRVATEKDLEALLVLKREITTNNFSFLDEQSRQNESRLVTDPHAVKRDIAKKTLWLAEKNGQLWAVGGIKQDREGSYSVFSGYSKGEKAGSAILSYIIFWAKSKTVKKIFAHTHEDNIGINQELQV